MFTLLIEQDLPNASGVGAAGDRVKSAGFAHTPDQNNDYLSEEAITASVAALGE